MAARNSIPFIAGARYGRLVVVEELSVREYSCLVRKWRCRCDCGNETVVRPKALRKGQQSCYSCRGDRQRTHGLGGTTEYRIWSGILGRCRNLNDKSYSRYGGRGITICERWLSFENFLADMGARPSHQHSIDRIDNDGGYEQSNCRWATRAEQARNHRRNRLLTYDGKTYCIADWATIAGIDHSTLRHRLDRLGWSVERAITTPPVVRDNEKTGETRLFSYNGETHSLGDWARITGIRRQLLHMRLTQFNWTLEKSLTTPVAQKGRRSKRTK